MAHLAEVHIRLFRTLGCSNSIPVADSDTSLPWVLSPTEFKNVILGSRAKICRWTKSQVLVRFY